MSDATSTYLSTSEYRDLDELVSIGIDVGSSTTHLVLSRLELGRRNSAFHRKTEILRKTVIYESPILFTPFLSDDTIDVERIAKFVEASCAAAGIDRNKIGAGAIICTGEAAKRNNARQITNKLADAAGEFVCAAAGHHLEARLAACGSGSVAFSQMVPETVVNLDIGGGTTKRTLINHGSVEDTSAISVGARLLTTDSHGRIAWRAKALDIVEKAAGVSVRVGDVLDEGTAARLADAMAGLLIEFLGLAPMGKTAGRLLVTAPPAPLPQTVVFSRPPRMRISPFYLICSGGVSEFFYEMSSTVTGDLGPMLAAALRRKLSHLPDERIRYPASGIRATVIGVSNFTLQASGETVFISVEGRLPLKNLPVFVADFNWERPDPMMLEQSLLSILSEHEAGGPLAVYLGTSNRVGYSRIQLLAGVVARVFAGFSDEVAFVFGHDVANSFGRALAKTAPWLRSVCIDEIEVGTLDFIDIGQPSGTYVPIVVKSLLFRSVQDSYRPK